LQTLEHKGSKGPDTFLGRDQSVVQ
jgi:hypothetical protein